MSEKSSSAVKGGSKKKIRVKYRKKVRLKKRSKGFNAKRAWKRNRKFLFGLLIIVLVVIGIYAISRTGEVHRQEKKEMWNNLITPDR